MRKIEVFIKTPFNTYISTTGEYSEGNKFLYLNDDNDMNGKKIAIDMTLALIHDIKSIRKDVEEHKQNGNGNDYSNYDTDDIRLEKVTIKGNFLICGYSINAGDYRRICVGTPSEPWHDTRTNNKTYLLCPLPYLGQVCW